MNERISTATPPQRFQVARITLEATAPFTIGCGRGNDVVDSVWVTDVHGLPAIPGSSLAGVLRHAFETTDGYGPEEAERLFGFQRRRGAAGPDEPDGGVSRVHVSWAHVHDNEDLAVSGRLDEPPAVDDPVIAYLRAGVRRDHVRINAAGVAYDRGKFDELLVPRGARFTFELRVDGGEAMGDLIGIVASPVFRLGAHSRRGLGAFRVVQVLRRDFDLSKGPFTRAQWPVSLRARPEGWSSLTPAPRKPAVSYSLALKARDFVIFGRGEPPEGVAGEKVPDLNAWSERGIVWRNGRGAVEETGRHVLVASGVKGALRHRAAFHLARFRHAWLSPGPEGAERFAAPEEHRDGLEPLFGIIRGKDGEGHAGRLVLEEVTFEATPKRINHVSIDRFTQGPIDGALFQEAPVRPNDTIRFAVHVQDGWGDIDPMVKRAFEAALEDLRQGRLALGGGSSRGHGYFFEATEARP